MADGIGLSVGATNLAAVVVNRTAVIRSPVLTLYPHRAPEVGVPSENPNLNERGLIITDFVDRVGDPVAIVAADGSTHRGEVLLADALRAMLHAVTRGRPAGRVGVTHPTHWPPHAVEALRNALGAVPEFRGSTPPAVVSDAAAALTALQNDPGVPTHGVIALCDFGGTGTSVTLVDAANGYQPIGPTVRHTDLSGDLIDQALLTHVINDLSAAGLVDLSGTSAIGALTRLRGQCRAAKERLSTATATSLVAELPGHRSDVRLTRNELDEVIRQPLTEFVGVLQEALDRNGIQPSNLVAVASAGGGARIPLVTTTLSEHFRVPVITTPQPELTAAIGGGLNAVRGTVEEGMTSTVTAAAATTAPAPAQPDELEGSTTFRALAWSEADDIPDVDPTGQYDYAEPATGYAGADARPQLQFGEREFTEYDEPPVVPWYRRPAVALGAGAVAVLTAIAVAVWFVTGGDSTPTPASTTSPVTTTTEAHVPTSAAPPPPAEPPAPGPEPPRTRTVTQQAPPPETITQAPPPPPPPPPETTEAPPPPTTEAPPPTTEPPPTTTEAPPPTTRPPFIPTLPTITIPGLPPIPIGPQPAQPAP
jgi:hypothetical protein